MDDDHEVTLHDCDDAMPAASSQQPPLFDGLLWRRVPGWVSEDSAARARRIGDTVIPASDLSVAKLEALQDDVHREVAQEALAAQEALERQLEEQHQQAVDAGLDQRGDAEQNRFEFMEQSNFYYAVPRGATNVTLPCKGLNPSTGMRERPVPPSIPKDIQDVPDAALPHVEQEKLFAERLDGLGRKATALRTMREAAEFDCDELMFDGCSSDDSDGYDEDFQDEWRDETNAIFSACRAVECNLNDEAAFYNLGMLVEGLKDDALTPTEQEMIWNALRYVYRKAEPVHGKHWFTSCNSILADGGFASRPSVGNWCFLLSKVVLLTCLSERRQQKLQQWRQRVVFLVRKRLVILREFGIALPTWGQLHVSVGDQHRSEERVPYMTLHDTLEALTATSLARCGTSATLRNSTTTAAVAAPRSPSPATIRRRGVSPGRPRN